ncbi:hypothetical protein F8388_016823 [Cannabis sativa]|uniref:Uncharacterized protein n=1 Tax=Cannabis sativa TaxID=3483 RepID=A0A7J6ERF8_CANSA|nr:hypothetical protein F8388_016823 [Cannabis sativa]
MALSLPATSSTAYFPDGTLKCLESMNFTALRDSMIHPGSGDVASSCLGGMSTPLEELKSLCGPSSKVNRQKLLNSNSIQEWATSRVLLNTRIVECYSNITGSGSESPSINITTETVIKSLQWKITTLRRH